MSDYMNEETCSKIVESINSKLNSAHQLTYKDFHELFAIVDKEIESHGESNCDNCDDRMPDEPSYNEGYM